MCSCATQSCEATRRNARGGYDKVPFTEPHQTAEVRLNQNKLPCEGCRRVGGCQTETENGVISSALEISRVPIKSSRWDTVRKKISILFTRHFRLHRLTSTLAHVCVRSGTGMRFLHLKVRFVSGTRLVGRPTICCSFKTVQRRTIILSCN